MTRLELFRFLALPAVLMLSGPGSAQSAPPNPILYLAGLEYYSAGGKNWVRHRYDVFNKDQFPAELFAAAPNLPPCGTNTNSSRSWVDFFDQTGRRLYGFCALGNPSNLGSILVCDRRRHYPAELCLYRDHRPADQPALPLQHRRHHALSSATKSRAAELGVM